jgi:hypothetical protein
VITSNGVLRNPLGEHLILTQTFHSVSACAGAVPLLIALRKAPAELIRCPYTGVHAQSNALLTLVDVTECDVGTWGELLHVHSVSTCAGAVPLLVARRKALTELIGCPGSVVHAQSNALLTLVDVTGCDVGTWGELFRVHSVSACAGAVPLLIALRKAPAELIRCPYTRVHAQSNALLTLVDVTGCDIGRGAHWAILHSVSACAVAVPLGIALRKALTKLIGCP